MKPMKTKYNIIIITIVAISMIAILYSMLHHVDYAYTLEEYESPINDAVTIAVLDNTDISIVEDGKYCIGMVRDKSKLKTNINESTFNVIFEHNLLSKHEASCKQIKTHCNEYYISYIATQCGERDKCYDVRACK